MHMTLRYSNGRMADCILLAANHNTMRIVVRGGNETVELRLSGENWVSETGEQVEIVFVAACSPTIPGAGLPPYLRQGDMQPYRRACC